MPSTTRKCSAADRPAAGPLSPLAFAERFIRLRRRPISFAGRPYLPAIYASRRRRLVLRASRQVEKTTFLVNAVLHTAATRPGVHILCVFPRREQALVFSRSRLMPTLQESPLLRRRLLGKRPRKTPVTNLRFANGSEIYIRAAYHTADAARGVDADMLVVDEFQDVAAGDLPVLEEALSHSAYGRVLLTGTPKMIENPIEGVFAQSTAHAWQVPCGQCRNDVVLDDESLGPTGPWCPRCQGAIDPAAGRWVPRNPHAVWGDGFWINHLMVPWVAYPSLLEKQQTYDQARFLNECLGLPTTLGDHLVTRAEVEACCVDRAMARRAGDVPAKFRDRVLAGIDWGGGGVSQTALAIGYIRDDQRLVVVHVASFPPRQSPEETLDAVAALCREMGVALVAADAGGNGSVYNPLLLTKLPKIRGLFGVHYSACDQVPQQWKGRLWQWTVGRTPSLGMLFARIKKGQLALPRPAECGPLIDQTAGATAEYDDQRRSLRYTHPPGQTDDALHALNYLAVLAHAWLDRRYTQLHGIG